MRCCVRRSCERSSLFYRAKICERCCGRLRRDVCVSCLRSSDPMRSAFYHLLNDWTFWLQPLQSSIVGEFATTRSKIRAHNFTVRACVTEGTVSPQGARLAVFHDP
jgi:hypothetical protein